MKKLITFILLATLISCATSKQTTSNTGGVGGNNIPKPIIKK